MVTELVEIKVYRGIIGRHELQVKDLVVVLELYHSSVDEMNVYVLALAP